MIRPARRFSPASGYGALAQITYTEDIVAAESLFFGGAPLSPDQTYLVRWESGVAVWFNYENDETVQGPNPPVFASGFIVAVNGEGERVGDLDDAPGGTAFALDEASALAFAAASRGPTGVQYNAPPGLGIGLYWTYQPEPVDRRVVFSIRRQP